MVRKIELKSISKPEDVKSYIENDNELKDYKIMYVGMTKGDDEEAKKHEMTGNKGKRVNKRRETKGVDKRLKEYYAGISGQGSSTAALVRSVVRRMNKILPFDNIVRTYINTGIFVHFESENAAEMEKKLIEILKPKLNAKRGESKSGKHVYIFLHKHTPKEFLETHFPELKNTKEYILRRCFELNLEALPYDEEQVPGKKQEALNLNFELKTNSSY